MQIHHPGETGGTANPASSDSCSAFQAAAGIPAVAVSAECNGGAASPLASLALEDQQRLEQDLAVACGVLASPLPIIVTDINGCIERVNQAFTNVTGYAQHDLTGRPAGLLRSRRHDDAFYQHMWQQLTTTGHWQGEVWNRRKNGEVYSDWLTVTAIRDGDNVTRHYLGYYHGLGPLGCRAASQRSASLHSLLAEHEQEAKRLTTDLHDDLGAALAVISTQVNRLNAANAAELRDAGATIATAVNDMHQVIGDMLRRRPPALDLLGLEAALRRLVRDWSTRHGIRASLDVLGHFNKMNDLLAISVYRLTAEALTNIARHANATHVSVRLAWQWPKNHPNTEAPPQPDSPPESLRLTVQDNGQGLPPGVVPGMGLLGMEGRAAALEGQLTLENTPGGGLTIQVKLPPLCAALSND